MRDVTRWNFPFGMKSLAQAFNGWWGCSTGCECSSETSECSLCKPVSLASGCDIPPPPWYPKLVSEVYSCVCDGGIASLRLQIVNCGPQAREFSITTTPTPRDNYGAVEIEPGKVRVDAVDSAHVVVRLKLSADGPRRFSRKIVVRGCKTQIICWTIQTHQRGTDACHEVTVTDAPDYVHHWYDHFYCDHSCVNSD